MSFLRNIRNQPQPVRFAVTLGAAILILAMVVPLWLASLKYSFSESAEQVSQQKQPGALGLFVQSIRRDAGKQLGGLEAMVSDALGNVRGGNKISEKDTPPQLDDTAPTGNQSSSPRSPAPRTLPRSN